MLVMQDDVTYTGFTRSSSVEFYNAGQEGWYDNFDPRYSMAFLDAEGSTYGNGFNSAIGVFGSNNIPVEDNVIYHFINNGIFVEGTISSITGESVARLKMPNTSIVRNDDCVREPE